MAKLEGIKLTAPYVVLIGTETNPTYAKTGQGLVDWCPELVAGQLRLSNDAVDLGVPNLPIEGAINAGVKSLIIGVAPIGGDVPDSWWEVIEQAARSGLDIVSGLHIRLADNTTIHEAAAETGARLIDIRVPPQDVPVGTGIKRTGKRVLMVGTDCAIGKKYTALSLDRSMREAGLHSTFRATGQTGIMIAGTGIPIDAVVADFISGAAELISPENDPDHWDVIEGQGSLFHPGYSGVSLGLLHGSQPDAFIVCHDATRKTVSGWDHFSLPTVKECIDTHVAMGRRTNPAIRCLGVSVNTSKLTNDERSSYLDRLSEQTGLPCVDPMIDGCSAIVNFISSTFCT